MFCRYYALEDRNIIGFYTVLPADCTSSTLAEGLVVNNAISLLQAGFASSAADQAIRSAEMKARLDAAQPLVTALLAEPQPWLAMVRPGMVVWQGRPTPVCYNVPFSGNQNPKILVLYIGEDDSSSYYPTGLGGTSVLPLNNAGCVNISVSRGIPITRYTIALEDPTNGGNFGAMATFDTDRAAVTCVALSKSVAYITTTITWIMPTARATVRDTIRVMNQNGDVVYWFYTSCKCNTVPGPVPVPTGGFAFRLFKSVPGGFTFELFPGGGAVSAAIAPDWMPWAKMGW